MVATLSPARSATPAGPTGGAGHRALRIAWPAAAVIAAFLALAVALELGGAASDASRSGLSPLVAIGRPAAQMLVNLAASVVLGVAVIAAWALQPKSPQWSRLLDWAAAAAGVWTVASASMVLLHFLAAGGGVDGEFGSKLIYFVSSIPLGQAWTALTMTGALLTVLFISVRSLTGAAFLVVATVAALIPLALQGHSADAGGDHGAAITAFGLHIVGAAAWLGGLGVVLVLGLSLRGRALADLAARYSSIALVCFVVVGFSGVVSAAIRLGPIGNLATPYGGLIVVKTITLVAAGALGAAHRFITIPKIAAESGRRPFLQLVGVELLVLGVASGFAAGLSVTPTPDLSIPASVTPAQILTDTPLPPPLTPVTLMTQWRFDPLWVLACAILAVLYVVGVRRLRQRGDAWPASRTVSWLAGLALLFWITNGGLNRYQEVLFSAHMLAHMALTLMVPLLLVPAAPITLALRAIAKRQDGTRGGREWILLGVHSRVSTVLTNPLVAAVLFAGSLVVFYFSPVFRWATTDHIGHEWMTVHFLITGYLFVLSMAGVDPVPFRFPYPIRLLVLLATMAFHAFFGLALILGNGLLLADWYGAMGWGTSALADQQAGGGVMWSVGEIPTLVLAIVVAVNWSRSDDREAKRSDRRADRTDDADLRAYNAMLERMGSRGA